LLLQQRRVHRVARRDVPDTQRRAAQNIVAAPRPAARRHLVHGAVSLVHRQQAQVVRARHRHVVRQRVRAAAQVGGQQPVQLWP
jgi:hypothetical protein